MRCYMRKHLPNTLLLTLLFKSKFALSYLEAAMLLLFCIKFNSISVMSVSLRSFFKETVKVCVGMYVEMQFGVSLLRKQG